MHGYDIQFWAPILECSRFNYNHAQVLWTFDSILHVYRLVSKCFFVIVLLLSLLLFVFALRSHCSFHIDMWWMFEPACIRVTCISFLLQFKCLNGFSYTVTLNQYPVVVFVFVFILFRCIVFKRCCTWTTSSKERKKNQ